MAYEVEMPENMDAGGGEFIEKSGWYHLAVVAVDESPTDRKGQLISGFKASVCVLAGEHADQTKKTADLTLWNPKPTDKNNGEMAKKKQARFLAATCVIDPAIKPSPGKKVTVDINNAVGRQLVARIEMREVDGKKYSDFHFADIYHVDDPAVVNVPKLESALKLLPKELRRDPASFKKAEGGTSASGNGSASPPAAKKSPAMQQMLDVNDPSLSF